jgi:hypothetical protein
MRVLTSPKSRAGGKIPGAPTGVQRRLARAFALLPGIPVEPPGKFTQISLFMRFFRCILRRRWLQKLDRHEASPTDLSAPLTWVHEDPSGEIASDAAALRAGLPTPSVLATHPFLRSIAFLRRALQEPGRQSLPAVRTHNGCFFLNRDRDQITPPFSLEPGHRPARPASWRGTYN